MLQINISHTVLAAVGHEVGLLMNRCPELKVKWNICVRHRTSYICFSALKTWNQMKLSRGAVLKLTIIHAGINILLSAINERKCANICIFYLAVNKKVND